jgi:cbb3-type cytochrome oxidase subunit 3
MKLLITVIVVFIIIVYGYTFIHYKKKRRQSMDHVQEFHEKYKIKKSNINETVSNRLSSTNTNTNTNADTNTYQSIDFVDKDEFVSDIRSEVREHSGKNNSQTVPKKKLQF